MSLLMDYVAHDYQTVATDFIIDKKEAGLFLDMGLGKTVVTLTAIEKLKNDFFEVDRVLVIAPKRVAEGTWPDEMSKWRHIGGLSVSMILGSPKKRREALAVSADVYVITRDNVSWLVDELGKRWFFDMVVVDELSSFKNHQSKRFKKLKRVRPLVKRVVGLTGTPAPNGYMDLWAQVYLLDRGERLGKTITEYRRRYFNALYRHGYNEYEIKEGAKEEIDSRIADICVSMKARDYLDMEEPTKITRLARMEEKELKLYKQMEKDAVLELSEDEITALSAAAVTNKLLQLANGAVYTDGDQVLKVHDKKLDVLCELIEEAQGEPVLVFYNFKHDKRRIVDRIPGVCFLETDEDVRRWNNKEISVLLAHPASAGHGLNLQGGGSIVVWFGLNWSLELYLQANARLNRQGQKEPVRIFHIVTEHTVDERVLAVLQGKHVRQEDLLRSIRADIITPRDKGETGL